MKTVGIGIAAISGNRIILQEAADVRAFRVDRSISILDPFGHSRGVVSVAAMDVEQGVIVTVDSVASTAPTACAGDTIVAVSQSVDSYDADHATLVAYLLCCVRRMDWHGASDAANDLRVLEASKR